MLSDRNLHLIDDHVDMAVRIGSLSDSNMVATRIGSMRTVVCASPKLLAGHGMPKCPEDMVTLPCVNFDFLTPGSIWPFQQHDVKALTNVAIRARLSVSTADAAVWAAAESVGATRVLHYQCAEAIRKSSVQIILAEFELKPLPVHLLHASRGALPTKARVFIDFAARRLRNDLKSL